ncbi:hypothetical protein ONZ45_g6720 [Pleurotus djamor]|nr:hypothetical protein ONZ45_g6720 [Pleurotus djamor]
MPLKDRLDRLRRRENAWATLQPHTRVTIKPPFLFGSLHGLRSGVLELGRATPISYRQYPSPPAKSLKYALLSKGEPCVVWKDWIPLDEDGTLSRTCVALHESDLLVVVTSTAIDPLVSHYKSYVHFAQLTTSLPHPQATIPHIEVITYYGAPWISSSVLGSHVALLYTFNAGAYDRLVVLNWMTGDIILNRPFQNPRTGVHFISLTTLLLGRSKGLEIWDITARPRCIGILSFPLLKQKGRGMAFRIAHIHGEPSPSQGTHSQASVPPLAVRDDPEKTLITSTVVINGFSKFLFVARRCGLLVAAEKLRTMATEEENSNSQAQLAIPYSEWAPNIVRWIHANELNIQWSMRHHGQRMILSPSYSDGRDHTLLLYDFNPYHVKKWTSKKALDNSTTWTAPPSWWDDSSVLPGSPLVVHNSTSGLPFDDTVPEMPYVCYQSEEYFNYKAVWMDGEHIVGVKVTYSIYCFDTNSQRDSTSQFIRRYLDTVDILNFE